MTTKNQVKKIMNQLKQEGANIFQKYPVLFAYVYGSYAKGHPHPFSDLDIAIFIHPRSTSQSLKTELSLALELDEFLNHSVETDIRSIETLPLALVGDILTEGILIYSMDDSSRIDFEVAMRKRYFDFIPVIKNYHKQYIIYNSRL